MKNVFIAIVLAAAGYLAWQQYKPVPPPPPPPPPPAILMEPAPVINEAEVAKIMRSAQDPDPGVRWETILFLEKMKAPQAQPLMFQMLEKDIDAEVRIKIAQLLIKRKSPETVAALVNAMKDQEAGVRVEVLKSLDAIGDYGVASAIANGPIRDQDENVRLQALKTLNSLQDRKQAEIDEARKRHELEIQQQQPKK